MNLVNAENPHFDAFLRMLESRRAFGKDHIQSTPVGQLNYLDKVDINIQGVIDKKQAAQVLQLTAEREE